MVETVTIDRRFCGPPASANGGYAAALAGQWLDGPAQVTLRVPPPLGTPLRVERRGDGVALLDGETVVAEAGSAVVDLDVPPPVSLDAARDAASNYPYRDAHPYPTCFVCGPEQRDGLAIFPGPVGGEQLFAAPWTPEPALAGEGGRVADAFVWSALDCPTGLATLLFGDIGQTILGRLAADLRRPVHAGGEHVVQAWALERDGRKLTTASALYSADGELCAVARAVWIEVPAGWAG